MTESIPSASTEQERAELRFRVMEPLGEGGMAEVFRAFDEKLKTQVALKRMKISTGDRNSEDPSHGAKRLARFIHEYEILKDLAPSPRIVTPFEFFQGSTAYSMELLRGQTLDAFIADSKGAPRNRVYIQECVRILLEVAEALKEVHAHQIVCCDLKPANIMVVKKSVMAAEVKLFDFGIARRVSRAHTNDPIEQPEAMVGTTYYMAPEQIRAGNVTVAADIYSFGVLAFELLSGQLPFNDPVLFNVTASHLAGKVPSIRELVPGVPGALERMIKICMEKKPADRYSSMGEIIARLRAISATGTYSAGGDSFLHRLRGMFSSK